MKAKGMHLLWMLFSFAWIVLETEADSYEIFKRKHLDNPKTKPPNGKYCEYMMKARKIDYLRSNVFIHEPESKLKKICPKNYAGPSSSDDLSLTLCLDIGGYFPAIIGNRRILVYCRDGLPIEWRVVLAPVHFSS